MLAVVMLAGTFIACSSDDDEQGNGHSFGANDATLVTNDQELRAAIKDAAKIQLANDIDLSNSTLSIPEGSRVSINLGGFTLDRKLAQRGEGGGQVITVRKNAKLTLSNGTLQGGWGGNAGGLVNEGGIVNMTDVNISGCAGDNRGGGICNIDGGTLTMTGGVITKNISYDDKVKSADKAGGGGIFNDEGATATLTGVKVSANEAMDNGGGICNYGTLTLDGCSIIDNTSKALGGGIWNNAASLLNMKGAMTITNNYGNDGMKQGVYLTEGAVITVTGSLEGSSIGITMETAGVFTSGYVTYNSGDPAKVFNVDANGILGVTVNAKNEAQLSNILPEGTIYYIERRWSETLTDKGLRAEVKTLAHGSYTTLTGGEEVELQPGYYVVKGNASYRYLTMANGGDHHIILCDGAKLEARFFKVEGSNTLHIYGQNKNSGKLVASEDYLRHAAIGGDKNKPNGPIFIHGGDIYAKGSPGSAGIGGGYFAKGGDITIYGGKIEAIGGRHHEDVDGNSDYDWGGGAGIGGGWNGNGGNVTIYGGNVKASGTGNGAGIGGGGKAWDSASVNGGKLTIMGGIVKCYGGEESAGIGGGYCGDGATVIIGGGEVYAYGADRSAGIGGGRDAKGGSLTVNGGYVYALAGIYAAGIGSGCEATFNDGVHGGTMTVTDGKVEAYGGVDAAGIGGGEDADGGTVNISGGYVYAQGNDGGAGIGGGEDGDGGNVTITGGTVIAKAGRNETGYRAIGPGEGSDVYGRLTLGDLMMVTAERTFTAAERKNACWYRTSIRVEPCTHPGYTANTCPYHAH